MKELQAKVAHLNLTLATKDKEIQDLSQTKAKYEDLRVEVLTLKQTNVEYKKSLGAKVKETLKLQKEGQGLKENSELELLQIRRQVESLRDELRSTILVAQELKDDNLSLERRLEEQERSQKTEREGLEDSHLDLQKQCQTKEQELLELEEQMKFIKQTKAESDFKLQKAEDQLRKAEAKHKDQLQKAAEDFEQL